MSDHQASNCSHFHIPLFFLFPTFPAMQYQRFLIFLIRFLFVRETEVIIRKAPLVRSPKQVIVPIFIFLYFFLFSTLTAMQYQRFFSLFDTFSHLKNLENAISVDLLYGNTTRTAACFVRSTKLSPVAWG